MPLQIHDGNWQVRKSYEVDVGGLAMRNLFDATFYSPDPHIWVFDGRNAKKARRDVYPGYKANRVAGSDEFYKTMDVFKDILKHTNKMVLEVPGYEGDDVIANLIKSTWGTEILLHANDGDFHVLCDEFVKMTHPALPKITGADARLYKTLVGDKSDNIPGIERFGPGGGVKGGGFLDLGVEHKEVLTKFFMDHPWAKDMGGVLLPSREATGFTESQYEKFCINYKDLCAFWRIVDFLDIPSDVMDPCIKIGVNNYPAADLILKGIMQ